MNTVAKNQAVVTKNRGYWGYQEIDTNAQKLVAGAGDGGGCGAGCGGTEGDGIGDGCPSGESNYNGGDELKTND